MPAHHHRLFDCLAPTHQGGVIVPGNFDGVHRGHAAMLKTAKDIASGTCPVVAVTFEPHPTQFFSGDTAGSFRLTRAEQKKQLLLEAGADMVDMLPFNAELASMEAQDFISDYFVERCAASHIVVGHDFVFGKGRCGNQAMLQAYAQEKVFDVMQCPPFLDEGGVIISSSRVREYLVQGRPEDATALLGRPYTTHCTVVKGDGVAGERLGFQTANLDFLAYIRPRYGVYAGRMTVRGKIYDAAINIGMRPTLFGTRECIEAHLIGADVPEDFYGDSVMLEWLRFIRPEKKFTSFEALKAAIAHDVRSVREYPA